MITGIGHTAYAVSDLEASLRFYCTHLGLREAFRLTHDDGRVWIVYLQVNENTFIELFPGAEGPVPAAGKAAGYRHLCLTVDDMHATIADLAGRGMPLSGQPTQGKDGNWQFWLTDPDGHRIELMQISPDSPQAQAGKAA
jgi:lactoylglutathione lyase